jgi:ketosteroid isomerase-like protein
LKEKKMKKPMLLLYTAFLCSILFSCAKPGLDIQKIKGEIRTILDEQKASWNEKSVEGFMEDYWKSEDFTFQSGNSRLHGWEALYSRYKKSYTGENWGELDFTDIEIKVLSNDYAFVLGRWKLTFKDSSKDGLFTIIFQRRSEGWKIIHDHSS